MDPAPPTNPTPDDTTDTYVRRVNVRAEVELRPDAIIEVDPPYTFRSLADGQDTFGPWMVRIDRNALVLHADDVAVLIRLATAIVDGVDAHTGQHTTPAEKTQA
jgi:hypothetical protein